MKQNYIFYGSKVYPNEVIEFINHTIETNNEKENMGERKTPLCIWGEHGVEKTQIIEEYAKENNFKFSYIAPAQFEEMGDLVGMPKIIGDKTHFIPPQWVPNESGPGILLIDDVNRADERILRGIMQLLQNFELVSWNLPPMWQIILTANPDGGDYSVTPMDFAMITRMMHITLVFEPKTWSLWAEKNSIDPRGINFILTYPELVCGQRNTPRSFVQFFQCLKSIKDLKKEIKLVKMLADSCLDESAVVSFISFIDNNLSKLISPEEILESTDFDKVSEVLNTLVISNIKRVDILSTICTRLINFISFNKKLSTKNIENFKKFLKLELIPNDLRITVVQDLVKINHNCVSKILSDPEIGHILLIKM